MPTDHRLFLMRALDFLYKYHPNFVQAVRAELLTAWLLIDKLADLEHTLPRSAKYALSYYRTMTTVELQAVQADTADKLKLAHGLAIIRHRSLVKKKVLEDLSPEEVAELAAVRADLDALDTLLQGGDIATTPPDGFTELAEEVRKLTEALQAYRHKNGESQ